MTPLFVINVNASASKIKMPIPIPTVKIGNQVWMTEDIKTTVYNNGDAILEASSENAWKEAGEKMIGCYRKLKNGTFVYNGFAVNDKRGIVPEGFAIPTIQHYNTLFKFLGGGYANYGKATKALATYNILMDDYNEPKPIIVKTNGLSGFKAKKGGYVFNQGVSGEGECSYWWTVSIENEMQLGVDIGYCGNGIGGGSGGYELAFGFAVRAIKK
jgi:hypothetical protein